MIGDKPFNVSNVRQITDQWDNEGITYSRMVELLNEIAIDWMNKKNKNNNPESDNEAMDDYNNIY